MKFSDIPFDKIVMVGNKRFLHTNTFNVNWLLGRYCNYNCSYCWPYAHTKKKDHRPLNVIIDVIETIFLNAHDKGFDKFTFSFSGGEPTLHPDFLDIIKYTSLEDSNVNITTNCSQSINWFNKLLKITPKISITASFHPEFETPERFIEKIKYLKDAGIYLQINIVLVHNNFDRMWEYAKYFYDQGISVQAKIEVEYRNNTTIEKPYTEDQLDKIKNGFPRITETNYTFEMIDQNNKVYEVDNIERVIGLGFNRFKGWECDTGYRSIIIHEPSGLVKRHYLCNDEPLGHIEKGFELYDSPKECITEICGSCADCKIPKYRRSL